MHSPVSCGVRSFPWPSVSSWVPALDTSGLNEASARRMMCQQCCPRRAAGDDARYQNGRSAVAARVTATLCFKHG